VEPFLRLSLTDKYKAYLRGESIKFPDPRFRDLFGMEPTEVRPCTYEDLKMANESQDKASVIRGPLFRREYNRLKEAERTPEL
jgi:hypothetical protein